MSQQKGFLSELVDLGTEAHEFSNVLQSEDGPFKLLGNDMKLMNDDLEKMSGATVSVEDQLGETVEELKIKMDELIELSKSNGSNVETPNTITKIEGFDSTVYDKGLQDVILRFVSLDKSINYSVKEMSFIREKYFF